MILYPFSLRWKVSLSSIFCYILSFIIFLSIIKTTSKLVVCTDPRGVSTCWPLEGVLKNIIASFALLLVNQFSLVLHSILRERHFSRKSPSSFHLLCTILFPLKDERFFCFFLLPRLFYLPLVEPGVLLSLKAAKSAGRGWIPPDRRFSP